MQALANIEYIKDLNRSYMVIPEGAVKSDDNYCIRMLQAERPDGVLKLETRRINNRLMYYYDITSRQSLAVMAARAVLDYNNVKRLISGIINIIETAYEYLLEENDFILLPEQIFIDIKEQEPYLCYYPGYDRDIGEQTGSLLEFIMNKIDYKDKAAVLLVYELYAAARAEGFTFEHLKEKLKSDIYIDNKENQRKTPKASHALPSIKANTAETTTSHEITWKERSKNGACLQPTLTNNSGFIPAVMEPVAREREVLKYPLATYLYTASIVMAAITAATLLIKSGLMNSSAGNRLDYSKVTAMLLILLCVSAYLIRKLWNKKNRIAKIISDSEYVDPTAISSEPEHRTFKYSLSAGTKEKGTKESGRKETDTKDTGTKVSGRKETETKETSTKVSGMKVTGTKATGIMKTGMKDIGINDADMKEDIDNGEYNPTCLLNGCGSEGKYMLKPCDEARYRTIIIEEFPFFIGKLKKNVDYCLDKEVVSRCHAKLTKEQEQIYITDLNSTNGTFVNNELLQPYKRREVTAGDEIAFADIRYQFIM